MPQIPLASNEAQRAYGRLPHIQLRNVFPEGDTTSAAGVTYLQRPGLAPFADVGGDAVDLVWRQLGTFNDDYLVAAGAFLYRVDRGGAARRLGAIGYGPAQAAGSADRVIIFSGGKAYSTDGVTVVPVPMPDDVGVSGVAFVSGFFVLIVADSQRFYWIAPDETNPDPLSFAEAERSPDAIIAGAVVGDEVWFLGQNGEEVWGLTGDIDAPFQRINGRVYENGCAGRDSVVEVDTKLIWVGADYAVHVAAGAPVTSSPPAINEHLRLAAPGSLRAWFTKLDGHVFYILTSDRDTFVYDLSTRTWARWASIEGDVWRAHLGSGALCGDSSSGKLWMLDPARSDDDGAAIERIVSGGVENGGAPVRCNSVSIRAAVGWSPTPGYEPGIEMRYSDDEGNLWSLWQRRGLGGKGQYSNSVVWRKQGLITAPGRLFEFRMTDDALFRLSYAQFNEAFG